MPIGGSILTSPAKSASSRRRSRRTLSHSSTISSTSTSSAIFGNRSNQPSLDDLTLDHLLNGETCPPISFQDFASFIANKEFSTENLLFVLWFRSYRQQFEQLSAEEKAKVPVPSTRLRERYTPFAYLDKATTEGEIQPSFAESVAFILPSGSTPRSSTPQHLMKPCAWTNEGKSCDCGDPDHKHPNVSKRPSRLSLRSGKQPVNPEPKPIIHQTLHPPLPPARTVYAEPALQPLREEAQRAFATFLKSGGSKELGVSDDLRQFVRMCFERTTAPEAVSDHCLSIQR